MQGLITYALFPKKAEADEGFAFLFVKNRNFAEKKIMINMQSIAPLIDYFEKIIPLSQEEKELVNELFKHRLYRKRQFVLQEGDVCKYFNFVVRGCLRMYKIDDKGVIHILQFASENWWINDNDSFHQNKPSQLSIDALEDTMVLQINLQDLTYLYKKSRKFNLIFRVLLEKAHTVLQRRLLLNISSSAQEKYKSFVKNYPHLLNRLPQTQIAAFLGVTPEFLSRIKSEMLKNDR